MLNMIFLVIVMVIAGVPLVQKEEDMKKTLAPDVSNDQFLDSFDSLLESFWSDDQQYDTAGYLRSTIKRSKKYMCYMKEAVKQNMDCSLQCLKYLYACENI